MLPETNIVREQGQLGSEPSQIRSPGSTLREIRSFFSSYTFSPAISRTSDRGIHYSHSSDTRGLEGGLSTVDRLYRRHAHDIEWSCGASRRPWQNGMLWVDNCQSREEFEHSSALFTPL